ncbi:hypothetical protein BOTBODRAFT_643307, partial [Botryobasidium botryosum FD-172 SS1]
IGPARLHLGSSDEHTTFEAEVAGTILALNIIRERHNPRDTIIALDNQSAIKAIYFPHNQPGQYLLMLFHQELTRTLAAHPNINITLQWTPGHEGIIGNELADEHAKKAANGDSQLLPNVCTALTKPLPVSVAATKASMKTHTRLAIIEHTQTAPRLALTRRIDHTVPNPHLHRTYAQLPR